MLRWDQPADHTLPPHEVKLYALDMARTIHEWADLQDICTIVEAKSKVPGLLLNKVRLRTQCLIFEVVPQNVVAT